MVNISLSSSKTKGAAITDAHFGANVTFDYQNLYKIEQIDNFANFSLLRHPGGSESEATFDISDPNNSLSNDNRPIIPMDDFLEMCVDRNIQPIIVVPISQLQRSGNDLTATSEADLRAMIRQAMEDSYPTGIKAFELGNEYWGQGLSSKEYGIRASAAAEIIQDEIESFMEEGVENGDFSHGANVVDPDIIAQIWGDKNPMSTIDLEARNETVINEFNSAEITAIDAVSLHFYYQEGKNLGQDQAHTFSNIDEAMQFGFDYGDEWRQRNAEIDTTFTEWNVQFETDNYTGMRQIAPTMAMFRNAVLGGADTMVQWPMQFHKTALAHPTQDELMLIGSFMEFLQDKVTDMNVVDVEAQGAGYDTTVFSKGDTVTIFVASRQSSSLNVDLNYANLLPHGVTGLNPTRLGYSGADQIFNQQPGPGGSQDPDATLTVTPTSLNNATNGTASFTLNDYGVMVLEFSISDQVIHGTSQYDNIDGTVYSEKVFGKNKGDTIHGGGGDDTIFGDHGEDKIYGEEGDDRLFGGVYNDLIYGGSGNDYLKGEDHHDTLFGGEGDDSLYGGKNYDRLHGEDGNDILDGGWGKDTLDGGNGNDSLLGGAHNDILAGGSGNDTVNGQWGSDTIDGGSGNDFVRGADGNDLLTGGQGSDVFDFDFNDGTDTITDFQDDIDIIRISGASYSDLTITQSGQDTRIIYDDGVANNGSLTIILDNFAASDVNANDFLFT